MRKLHVFLFIIGLSLMTFSVSKAQSFNAGLIAGPTFCQVDGDRHSGYHKIGLTGGGFVNYPVSDHFALQMELKYTQMGAHSSAKEWELYGNYDLRLHYAEIPIMVLYDFGHFTVGGKPLDFASVEAGLSLDFLLKYFGELDYSIQSWKLNFFSITGNFGLHFKITHHLGLGARMMYSVLPMQTNPTPQWFFNHAYNKVIQFTLTYTFNAPTR